MNKKIVNASNFNDSYGNVGEVTPFVIDGQYLQVGDVVSICGHGVALCNEFVVKDAQDQYFIMGLQDVGMKALIEEWDIKLIKKYYEVKHREIVEGLILIDMDEENEKIMVDEFRGNQPCKTCKTRAAFLVSFDENKLSTPIALCPDCLADLGKKIIDVLK